MFNPIASSSANKEKIVNENFLFQEAFNFGVIDRSLSSPPVNPSSQGVYIPAASATGAWAGKENQLLWWNSNGYWRAIAPRAGMKIFSQVEGEIAIEYLAGEWQAISATATSGGSGYKPAMPVPKNFWQFDGNLVDVQEARHFNNVFYEEGTHYSFVPSILGQAIEINDRFDSFHAETSVVMSQEFSIAAWIKKDKVLKFGLVGSNYSTASESYHLGLTVEATNSSLTTDVFFNSSFFDYAVSSGSQSDTTSFHGLGLRSDYLHIVLTRDYQGTDAVTTCYLDGVPIGQNTDSTAVATGRTNIMTMFYLRKPYAPSTAPPTKNTFVDNLRFYDRALSAEEVVMLANE